LYNRENVKIKNGLYFNTANYSISKSAIKIAFQAVFLREISGLSHATAVSFPFGSPILTRAGSASRWD